MARGIREVRFHYAHDCDEYLSIVGSAVSSALSMIFSVQVALCNHDDYRQPSISSVEVLTSDGASVTFKGPRFREELMSYLATFSEEPPVYELGSSRGTTDKDSDGSRALPKTLVIQTADSTESEDETSVEDAISAQDALETTTEKPEDEEASEDAKTGDEKTTFIGCLAEAVVRRIIDSGLIDQINDLVADRIADMIFGE